MAGINFYILDLETNGLRCGYHEVVEFSIIRATDRVQLTRHIKCIYPERSSFDALQATGKTLKDLDIGVSKEEVITEVNGFFAKDGSNPASRCIVGHNVCAFDAKFLKEMWGSIGERFPADLYLDTQTLVKTYIKTRDLTNAKIQRTAAGKVSTKLHASLDLVGAKKITQQAHTAQSDTRNTYVLWKHLIDEHKMDYLPFIKNNPHILKTNQLTDINELGMDDIE